jgi:hypothetical protein
MLLERINEGYHRDRFSLTIVGQAHIFAALEFTALLTVPRDATNRVAFFKDTHRGAQIGGSLEQHFCRIDPIDVSRFSLWCSNKLEQVNGPRLYNF